MHRAKIERPLCNQSHLSLRIEAQSRGLKYQLEYSISLGTTSGFQSKLSPFARLQVNIRQAKIPRTKLDIAILIGFSAPTFTTEHFMQHFQTEFITKKR